MTDRERIEKATTYTFGSPPFDVVEVVRTRFDSDTWAIRRGAACLSREGEWEYEPMPSGRDDEFLGRHRFTLDEALARAAALSDHGSNPSA